MGEDEWPRSYSTAVRFTIAAGNLTAEARKGALADLISYCELNRFGLSLLDPRPSHRAGNWFTILNARIPKEAGQTPSIFSAYPITFVGPARIGSTAAITRCLNELDDLSLLSCSVTSLADLAFISVTIGLTQDQHRGLVSNLDTWHRLRDLPQAGAYDALKSVLATLGFQSQVSHEAQIMFMDRAGDYAACHGPLVKLNFNASQSSRAIWFSADGHQSNGGLQHLLSALYAAAAAVLEPVERSLGAALPDGRPVRVPNLDYLIARESRSGGYRIKGKLSIPDVIIDALLPSLPNGQRATLLAQHLEEDWSARLFGEGARFNVSVAWRENWLGHWSGRSSLLGEP